ncbi:MAG: TetR/AcrR family transcriptional regulator [Desulfobacula sp.]|jgi:TetR/AcrR family transcriptional regulator|uniref:TetR/AcrR family transcriptional regulator n=2 Tax=Desulfobacula sp. TaxID=2593537 RepID=UPI001D9EBF73|nr:TetR/AcrR family transcriptional regulator [Desulfobacula sp.]MBT3483937.1 TetR/AcrR family transcriptional regulator [Desulfobacula sp.]MBT3803876.1 TetR/AcrR family transcriptional regulator [Desulfobacula sp.]MBT4023821.1 TetR/AcrR family transcriptional regulator [Desulfobacula sp.]MBT4197619.1 TetR/AcrR family transcriptional regulator [Desulfobacula sp.]
MDKKKSTKDKIFSVAARHFADFGFEGTRMDRIAKEACVNKASIYYNIGNKEVLYAMVLNQSFKEGFGAFHEVIGTTLPAEKKLEAYIRHIAIVLEQNPVIPKILMREQLSQGRHLPDSFAKNIVQMLDGLTGILNQGNREGVFYVVDTVTIHFMILGTMLFQMTSSPIRRKKKAFLNKYQPEPGRLPPSVIDQICRYILRAVKKEK